MQQFQAYWGYLKFLRCRGQSGYLFGSEAGLTADWRDLIDLEIYRAQLRAVGSAAAFEWLEPGLYLAGGSRTD